jgi:hypothetical protein
MYAHLQVSFSRAGRHVDGRHGELVVLGVEVPEGGGVDVDTVCRRRSDACIHASRDRITYRWLVLIN